MVKIMEQELSLNPDTVSLLANKIKAGLNKAKDVRNGKLPENKQKATSTERKHVIDSESNGKASGPRHPPKTNNTLRGAKGRVARIPNTGSETRGKKRSRDGQLKEPTHGEIRTTGVATTRKSVANLTGERSDLEQDILALGGSKDDLDLIEGDASESEIDGDASTSKAPTSKGLKKELLRFVQELGIKEVPQEAKEGSELDEHETDSALRSEKSKAPKTARVEMSALPRSKPGEGMPIFVCVLA